MAKAKKQITRARKTCKTISTIKQAIAAYGGLKAMTRRFDFRDPNTLHDWIRLDFVPRGWQLSLYLGLTERGYDVSPELMGVHSWEDIPGVAVS